MTTDELERAKNEIIGTNFGEVQCHESTMRTAVEAIDKCLKQAWIPCSERLPETDENELVVDAYGSRTIAWHTEAGNWLDLYDSQISDVVAWMPLPDPYREEKI